MCRIFGVGIMYSSYEEFCNAAFHDINRIVIAIRMGHHLLEWGIHHANNLPGIPVYPFREDGNTLVPILLPPPQTLSATTATTSVRTNTTESNTTSITTTTTTTTLVTTNTTKSTKATNHCVHNQETLALLRDEVVRIDEKVEEMKRKKHKSAEQRAERELKKQETAVERAEKMKRKKQKSAEQRAERELKKQEAAKQLAERTKKLAERKKILAERTKKLAEQARLSIIDQPMWLITWCE